MAKKKKGSKIKKFLKGAALAGAAALGAKALARNRSIADNEAKEFGFGQMKLKDYGPYSSKKMNAARNFKFNPTMMLQGVGDDMGGATIDGYPIQAGAKKGGRIVKTKSGGKAIRGYGRAYMKGRK